MLNFGRLEKLKFNTFSDARGDLSVFELEDQVEWKVERAYWCTNTKLERGGHSVRGEKKFYICLSGEIKARFHDGKEWQEFVLKGPDEAIVMEGDYYREFYDFSDNSVLLALSSKKYVTADYIYDFEAFLKEAKG
jgi:hypothetical protein